MGALPRPVTPGPWDAEKDDASGAVVFNTGGYPLAWMDDDETDAGLVDAAAIAALPERIAREDRVRAYCARVIARTTMPREHMQDVDYGAMHGMADMAQEVVRILDGEEGA